MGLLISATVKSLVWIRVAGSVPPDLGTRVRTKPFSTLLPGWSTHGSALSLPSPSPCVDQTWNRTEEDWRVGRPLKANCSLKSRASDSPMALKARGCFAEELRPLQNLVFLPTTSRKSTEWQPGKASSKKLPKLLNLIWQIKRTGFFLEAYGSEPLANSNVTLLAWVKPMWSFTFQHDIKFPWQASSTTYTWN